MGGKHRSLRIAALAIAGAVVIGGGIAALAAYNLTALIAHNQHRILARVSNSFGRPVSVGQINAHVGLGLAIEVDNLKIADDPAFSRDPFVSASKASLAVKFLPLLQGKVKVQELELTQPVIRILKRNDKLNVDTFGVNTPANPGIPHEPKGAGAFRAVVWAIAREVSIKGLKVEDGTIYYSDPSLKGVPLQINHLGIDMSGFHTGTAFDVETESALFSDKPNFALYGKMGPMLRQGVLDISGCPLDLKFKAGPVTIDNLR